ncbi:hypothetical protein HOG17_01940 [Candidatus Peregrinibacteria bacterium]|nr:hypothetical protein [Candidatus Peregrinibacteria bacterium]MBT4148484.1 hypothetical protein [Candidatus Peregrinibacteria bacterium]MBT4366663.1 hypothetical protein [Candidatus Peregrinibacteria bacterium]MBT4456426.1 hypothetical protein [Candidatus Peregrinibacteria bacterium]
METEQPLSQQLEKLLTGIESTDSETEETPDKDERIKTTLEDNADLIKDVYKNKPFTKKEIEMLTILCELGESYGLDIIETSGGKFKRGTIYVHLSKMEEKGLVTGDKEESSEVGPRRRKFKITEETRERFQTWLKLLKILDLAVLKTD